MEPFFAALASAASAAAPAAGTTAATAGATAAAATGVEAAVLAGAAATAPAAAATGLTATQIAAIASGVAGVAGTGAQLLAEKPKVPNISPMTRDDAALEANQRSELYKRRGRAATLLTPGGAKGDTSSPSLGAAALLGA